MRAKDVDALIYPKNLSIGDKFWKSGKALTVTMIRPRGDKVIVETREAGPVVLDAGVRVEAEKTQAYDASLPTSTLALLGLYAIWRILQRKPDQDFNYDLTQYKPSPRAWDGKA